MSSHVHCQINSSGNLLDWCDVHDVEMPVTMKFRINASMKVICFTTVTETIEAFSGSSTQAATMLLCLVMLLTWIGSCSLWTVSNWWCWKVSGAKSRRQAESSRFDLVIFFQMRLVRLMYGRKNKEWPLMYAIFYAFQPSFTHKLREIYSLLAFVFVVILVS